MRKRKNMQDLPIGIQNFEDIRKEDFVYVDKTKLLFNLVRKKGCYFLSRPRRFGKSLTVSTLEAMFQGKAELFKGLYAEEWVKEQAKHPNPVIKLDMGDLGNYENTEEFKYALIYIVKKIANDYKLNISYDETISKNAGLIFSQIINELYKQFGKVIILIDEYDKPITDNIDNLEKANKMRETLRSFYSVLKNSDEVKFIMITGISKFSKVGIFSGLNNLDDISMNEQYGDIVGYTQKELEKYFVDWLEKIALKKSMNRQQLLDKIKEHYDGFSFDGITRVYNPFSVLKFFGEGKFRNYWYDSATPSFLAKYFKDHKIQDSDDYRHLKVSSDFTNASEIEHASPESFLFQTGYLTIEKWDDEDEIILDYPNEEVKKSLPKLYLNNIYNISDYIKLANEILNSLKSGNIINVMIIFNGILARIPYDDFSKEKIDKQIIESLTEEQRKIFENLIYSKKEKWYRSLFIMLLSVVKVELYPEVHTNQGRPDVVIPFDDKIIIIEFKLAPTSKDVLYKKKEGEEQIKKYLPAYANQNKQIITVVFVANDEKRQVIL